MLNVADAYCYQSHIYHISVYRRYPRVQDRRRSTFIITIPCLHSIPGRQANGVS